MIYIESVGSLKEKINHAKSMLDGKTGVIEHRSLFFPVVPFYDTAMIARSVRNRLDDEDRPPIDIAPSVMRAYDLDRSSDWTVTQIKDHLRASS